MKLKKNALLLSFVASSVVVVILSIFVVMKMGSTFAMLERDMEQRLLALSKAAAALVTAEELAEFETAADMEKPLYGEVRRRLVNFTEESEILYTYYMRPEGGKLQFIVDNDPDPETMVNLLTAPVDFEPAPEMALSGTAASAGVGTYSESWDSILSAWAPIYDEEGNVYALAGVDMSDAEIRAARGNATALIVLQVVVVAVVIASGLLALYFYNRKAVQSEAASIAKSQFLSRMSHEIRTPLNAIIGLCRMARQSDDLNQTHEYLDSICTSSSHLLRLINDILDLSKIETGKVSLELVSVDIYAEIDNICKIIQPAVDEKNQVFKRNITADIPPFLCCDPTHLRQVAVNLLSNAVKFTPEGGEINFGVELLECHGGRCHLKWTVRDNGIGIETKNLPGIFDPFEQGDGTSTRKYGGTGLGLAISRQLVEMMGGAIAVHSVLGEGSEFSFDIWLEIAPEQVQRPPAARAVEAETVDLQGRRLLLAEDSEINQMIAENLFEGMGAQVDVAPNGLSAFEQYIADPQKYDLIFMDIQMPVMDGYEATRQIRASGLPGAETIPIIAMTANVFREDVQQAMAAGMNAHVGKPFEVAQVEDAIRAALRH